MPACAFTSKPTYPRSIARSCSALSALLLLFSVLTASSWAQSPPPGSSGPGGSSGLGTTEEKTIDRNVLIEDEDFSSTPHTEYGEFAEDKEEADATEFFHYGRFFGVSVGTGLQGVTGNRGAIYQGGYPILDLRVHYWFSFNVAMDLGFYTVQHNFQESSGGPVIQTSFFNVGVNIKFYFNVKELSAPIAFANPYLIGGFGSYSVVDYNTADDEQVFEDTKVAPCIGAGLEFAVKNRKIYFILEGKFHFPVFDDTYSGEVANVPNLEGTFYTTTGSLMFTW